MVKGILAKFRLKKNLHQSNQINEDNYETTEEFGELYFEVNTASK